jgi:hypothetical protein
MTKLSDHQSAATTKMLFIGDSGSGKTGGLASLAKAGYNLRIIDLDNGLDVLANLLRGNPVAEARVEFETLTDKMRKVGGRLVPAKATVWSRTIDLLDNWSPEVTKKWSPSVEAANLGPLVTWGEQDILVIDSLTMLSTAALNHILAMNARLGQRPHQSDWYDGQQLVEGMLQTLYDDNIKCNVIVISHITYIGEEGGPTHGYPNTLGKALPPKVGRYFNSCLMARTTGAGTGLRRKILTNTAGAVELKNTAPMQVKPDYPLETGLADYFRDVRSAIVAKPPAVAKSEPPPPPPSEPIGSAGISATPSTVS